MPKRKAAEDSGDVYVSFKTNVPNHTRKLSKADFARAGIDHAAVTVTTGEAVKVSSDAADYLVDELNEFERVDAADVEEPEVNDEEEQTSPEDPPRVD